MNGWARSMPPPTAPPWHGGPLNGPRRWAAHEKTAYTCVFVVPCLPLVRGHLRPLLYPPFAVLQSGPTRLPLPENRAHGRIRCSRQTFGAGIYRQHVLALEEDFCRLAGLGRALFLHRRISSGVCRRAAWYSAGCRDRYRRRLARVRIKTLI